MPAAGDAGSAAGGHPGSRMAAVFEMLRRKIASGGLRPGERLPATRELARQLGVSRNTVLAAYERLLAEGYTRGRAGGGTRVADDLPDGAREGPVIPPRRREPRPARCALSREGARLARIENPYAALLRLSRVPYDFIYGLPPLDVFPHDLWGRLVARRARRRSFMSLAVAPTGGVPALRAAIAAHLRRYRGVDVEPERIVVVGGFQQAAQLLCRVLVEPGDRVVLEEAHYPGARAVLAASGARLHPAPVDDAGIHRLPQGRARLCYVTPSHQFPTGAVMAPARRDALLAWARRAGALVLEDDYDTEYRFEGSPIEPLMARDAEGRVVYAGSFSKSLYPSLRLGYVVVPPSLLEVVLAAKWTADWASPSFEQEVLADFMEGGHLEAHLRRARTASMERRAALLSAIHEHLEERIEVAGAGGGLHLALWCRERVDTGRLALRARELGAGVYPIESYYLRRAPRPGLLLGYGHLDPRGIRDGIARVAKAWGTLRA